MVYNENMSIIDYLREQCDRLDKKNIDAEHRVIEAITQVYDDVWHRVTSIAQIYGDINTTLKYELLCQKINDAVTQFYNKTYSILTDAVEEYAGVGHRHFDELMETAFDIIDYISSENVKEMQSVGADTIQFIRRHAFEQVTGIGNDIMDQMRSRLGQLLVGKGYNKSNVVDTVQDIMRTNRSRAEMIAQTEMSMAYNSGAMERMDEFNRASSGEKIRKYWYGFKYSVTTCRYCRPRIGNIYNADDDTEVLPAHPRCRCVWLPYMEGWDKPISSLITRRADMLKRVYSPDEIYARINKRLNIDYGSYLKLTDAEAYLRGDRSPEVMNAIGTARDRRIDDLADTFDVATTSSTEHMSREFKIQMKFWKEYTSMLIVDGDSDTLSDAYEAVKGVMALPWDHEQIDKWNKLLKAIKKHM